MKVLHVIDSFSFGGAEKLLASLAEVAAEAGFSMEVASLAPPTPERTAMLPTLENAGIRTSFLGVRRLLDPAALPRLVAAIRRSRCDIVHAHLEYASTLVPLAARIAGVPCVSTLHHVPGDVSWAERLKERLAVRSAERGSALVFVSEAARFAFADRYPPKRPTWWVVRNGVDLTAYTPVRGELPADLGIPSGAPVVTLVAALRAPKGHQTAIAAWSQVLAAVPDARLLVVGDGPERVRLETLVRELDLEDRVVFAGARTDVPEILAGSTLALLPSDTEALPTSLIEAAAAGLPTVATTVGGVPEVVVDDLTGVLVPPRDTHQLARAVVGLISDNERRVAMGRAARRRAETLFDLRVWARTLAELYAELAARRLTREGDPGSTSARASGTRGSTDATMGPTNRDIQGQRC